MVVLHTLGESTIRVSSNSHSNAHDTRHAILTPTAGTLFTLAAYLISKRGSYVSRAHLISHLWPSDAGTPAARQRLRSAIAKLRSRGIEVTSRGDRNYTVCINKTDAVIDDEWLEHEPVDRLLARDFTILPHYSPTGAPQLQHWVESLRDQVRRSIVTVLSRHLDAAKSCGDWGLMATLAERLLELNPYNSRAQQAAQYARNVLATRTIPLAANTTSQSPHLAEALASSDPTLLRSVTPPSQDAPLVGRRMDIALLSALLNNLAQGGGKGVYVWGERGIGKSRLMREIEVIARADNTIVVHLHVKPHNRLRPLSIISELAPQLNALPGAAGASAAMRKILYHFLDQQNWPAFRSDSLPNESQEFQVRAALLDLLDAVTDEQPIVLIVEDIHWADPLSAALLFDIAAWSNNSPILTTLTSRLPWNDDEHSTLLHSHQLLPLSNEDAFRHAKNYLALFDQSVLDSPDDAFLVWCVRIAGGNPYYLEETLRHWIITGHSYKIPPSVLSAIKHRIERVSDIARLVLHVCALNSNQSTIEQLLKILELKSHTLLPALQVLIDERLVDDMDESGQPAIRCRHEGVSAVALNILTPPAQTFLRQQM